MRVVIRNTWCELNKKREESLLQVRLACSIHNSCSFLLTHLRTHLFSWMRDGSLYFRLWRKNTFLKSRKTSIGSRTLRLLTILHLLPHRQKYFSAQVIIYYALKWCRVLTMRWSVELVHIPVLRPDSRLLLTALASWRAGNIDIECVHGGNNPPASYRRHCRLFPRMNTPKWDYRVLEWNRNLHLK